MVLQLLELLQQSCRWFVRVLRIALCACKLGFNQLFGLLIEYEFNPVAQVR